MADEKGRQHAGGLPDFSDPYYARSLYKVIREIILYAGRSSRDDVPGTELLRFTRD
ncbi:MAG: hypothetical protein GYA17_13000, partial [Chloroflexi bacterium]|nr:hypothetical protein [Chloroflexota bacterium]